jgi:hypothetical protein
MNSYYFVRLTFNFEDSPTNKLMLVELAPLELMPHTIHTFLRIISKKMFSKGTITNALSHIFLLGPEDHYVGENDDALKST